MNSTSDTVRAALLLSNRLTRLDVAPLKARDFWAVVERSDALALDIGQLLTDPSQCDAVAHDDITGDRLRTLLDATRAFAFDVERLDEGGVHLVSALDDRFPELLRDRLGHGCPPHLFAAGDVSALARPTLSIIGEPDASDAAHEATRQAVAAAVVADWSVATPDDPSTERAGLAATVIDEAVACGAAPIVLAAAGINRVGRQPDLRRLVQAGSVCLASPFPPDAPPSAAAVSARNSMVHAVGAFALVVGCADGTGTVWSAAFDAVQREPGAVLALLGPDVPAGNGALVELGARPLPTIDELHGLLT